MARISKIFHKCSQFLICFVVGSRTRIPERYRCRILRFHIRKLRTFRTKYAMNDHFSAIKCCVVNRQILRNDGTHRS